MTLDTNMNVSNACKYLNLSSKFQNTESFAKLISRSSKFLQGKFCSLETFFYKAEFLELPQIAIQTILKSQLLHISSENSVFSCLLLWGKDRKLSDEEWLELLVLCRFPNMTSDFIAQVIVPSIMAERFSEKIQVKILKLLHDAQWHHASPARRDIIRATSNCKINYRNRTRSNEGLGSTTNWQVHLRNSNTYMFLLMYFGYCISVGCEIPDSADTKRGVYMHMRAPEDCDFVFELTFTVAIKHLGTGHLKKKKNFVQEFTKKEPRWSYPNLFDATDQNFVVDEEFVVAIHVERNSKKQKTC